MIAENSPAESSYPHTVEEIVLSYTSSIVLRRWLGCVIDYIILFLVFLLPVLISKDKASTGTMNFSLALVALYFLFRNTCPADRLANSLEGLLLRTRDGQLPDFIPVILRTLARLIEVNPVLLGGIPAGLIVLASDKRQRLGDMLVGTYVLKFEDYTAWLQDMAAMAETVGCGICGE